MITSNFVCLVCCLHSSRVEGHRSNNSTTDKNKTKKYSLFLRLIIAACMKVTRSWTWPSDVDSQPRKANLSWAVSHEQWAVGQGRWFSLSALVRPSWRNPSSSGIPAQEGHGPLEVSPDEGHEDDQRNGAPFLWRWAERVEVVHLKEKASERPQSTFQYLKGAYKGKRKTGIFYMDVGEWS